MDIGRKPQEPPVYYQERGTALLRPDPGVAESQKSHRLVPDRRAEENHVWLRDVESLIVRGSFGFLAPGIRGCRGGMKVKTLSSAVCASEVVRTLEVSFLFE